MISIPAMKNIYNKDAVTLKEPEGYRVSASSAM